jgi:hypothetical protein
MEERGSSMEIVKFLMEHGLEILGAIAGLVTAAYGVALVIPGEQPDKAIAKLKDFTDKFSKKPKSE